VDLSQGNVLIGGMCSARGQKDCCSYIFELRCGPRDHLLFRRSKALEVLMLSLTRGAVLIAVCVGLSLTTPVAAAEPESCPGLIASRDTLFSRAALRQDEVSLTFVGHATFLIETPDGVRIATDYSDGTRPPVTPDVATMNKAYSTHFSSSPDPGIEHVLKGWNPAGGHAIHDLTGCAHPERLDQHPQLWRSDGVRRELHLCV
jgi:hypothetical protein